MTTNLILGCHGWKNFGLTMCRGTSNELLDLDKLGTETETILGYLDAHCHLYDKVVDDHNKVVNIVQYLIKQDLIVDHLRKQIYEYLSMHKYCRCYMFIRAE